MKLYLTATSERGKPITKSGNEYLKIILTANRQEIGQIDVSLYNNELVIDFTNDELITTNLCRGYIKSKGIKSEAE